MHNHLGMYLLGSGAEWLFASVMRSIIVFTMGMILSNYGFQFKPHTQPGTVITAISWVLFAGADGDYFQQSDSGNVSLRSRPAPLQM